MTPRRVTFLRKRSNPSAEAAASGEDSAAAVRVGMVLDHFCDTGWLDRMEEQRRSLPLDAKRPTVDRRFFVDDERRGIVSELERILSDALALGGVGNTRSSARRNGCSAPSTLQVHCNKYLRILEYSQPGSGLSPHTDGIKVCEETNVKSTHTLLLFLSDCARGGETVLLDGSDGWSQRAGVVVPADRVFQHPPGNGTGLDVTDGCRATRVSLGVAPRRGRIVVLPHAWPHAGALCQSVPKLLLRAEIALLVRPADPAVVGGAMPATKKDCPTRIQPGGDVS